MPPDRPPISTPIYNTATFVRKIEPPSNLNTYIKTEPLDTSFIKTEPYIKTEPADNNMVVSLPLNVSTNTVLVLNNNNMITTAPQSTTSVHHHSSNSAPSSKYLVLEPNHIITDGGGNYSLIKNEEANNNNTGGIVVLATQQLDAQSGATHHNQTDEELTSLTWLHDKNLLKGINLSCTKVQSVPGSPQRRLSPTSDFLEDSCVSEGNSSVNSNSDHGILLSPESTTTSSTIYYNNNNNSMISNKNRSPSSSASSSPPSSLSSPSSSIHLSPTSSGQIIEFQLSGSADDLNHHHHHHLNRNVATTPLNAASTTVLSNGNGGGGNGGGGGILNGNSGGGGNSTHTTPHQHFHKKYLREEHVKTLKQVGNGAMTNGASTTQYIVSPTSSSSPSMENIYSSPTTLKPVTLNRSLSSDVTSSYAPPRTITAPTAVVQKIVSPPKQKHPNNIAYDPLVHTHNKPPYSFSSLIFMAIEDAQEKALPVKEIYAWIVMHFPYFKTAPTGWKNSVRHNLSLSKSFQKVEKAPNMGKGSLWRVDPTYRPNLVQTMTRSQFHPCATIEKTSMKSIPRPSESPESGIVLNGGIAGSIRPLDAELFPRLSKCMAEMSTNHSPSLDRPSPASTPADEDYTSPNPPQSAAMQTPRYYIALNGNEALIPIENNNNNTICMNGNMSPERLVLDFGADNIDDVNAATAMLALKHGPKIFSDNYQSPVITSSPSEDHTYSQGGVPAATPITTRANSDNNSNGTSSDAAYESSEESTNHNNNNNSRMEQQQQHHHHTFIAHQPNGTIITQKELEEQRRHAEGVDALLNLAGIPITSPIILKRPASATSILEIQAPSSLPPPPPSAPQQHNHNQQQLQQLHLSSPASTTAALPPPPMSASVASIYMHSPPKKLKTKNLRYKLKKNVWMR